LVQEFSSDLHETGSNVPAGEKTRQFFSSSRDFIQKIRTPGPSELRKRKQTGITYAWQRSRDYGQMLIAGGVFLTSLYVVLIAMPLVIEGKSAAPFFKYWPIVNWIILIIHAALAMPPLVIGLAAFSKRIRNASLKVHRWIGTIYCVCIWISAILGIMLAVANPHGMWARLGFSCLGLTWFVTTWFAYTTGRARNIVDHRRWMIRSYAVTLAVVSIRPMFIFGPFGSIDPVTWYILCTWMCWVPNLLIGEIFILVTKSSGALKT